MGARRPPKDTRLSKAELIAATGISPRRLIRRRRQGLIPTIEPPHGRGRGRGKTPIEYPLIAIATIHRLNELSHIRSVDELRWRLWREDHRVRIARDLADTLGRFRAAASKIKTLSDIEKKILPVSMWKPANMPRGHPLRTIFRGLSDDDLRSLTTMLICVVLGIRLPVFDEANPYAFQVFKRAVGLPRELQMKPSLFDVFPHLYGQIQHRLLTATTDELEGAKAVCKLLSRLFDNPENSRRGAIFVGGAPLPWRPIKFVSLLWPSPVARATTVGLIILVMRRFRSAFGEEAAATFAWMASKISVLWPESTRDGPLDPLFGRVKYRPEQ
jgi:hypothetical protein